MFDHNIKFGVYPDIDRYHEKIKGWEQRIFDSIASTMEKNNKEGIKKCVKCYTDYVADTGMLIDTSHIHGNPIIEFDPTKSMVMMHHYPRRWICDDCLKKPVEKEQK